MEMGEALRSFASDASFDRGSQPARVGQRSRLKRWIVLFLVVFLGLTVAFLLVRMGREIFADDPTVVPLVGPERGDGAREKTRDGEAPAAEPEEDEGALVIDLTDEPLEAAPEVRVPPSAPEEASSEHASDQAPALRSRRPEALKLVEEADRALTALRLGEAGEAYDRALSMDPRIPEAWYGLGRVSFEKGDYRSAAAKVERALRLSPGRYRWRIYLGRIYDALGERDKAEAEWRRVLKTRPEESSARRLLGGE
jgi:tetratricopeptide (TPR) repeat protein